MGRGTGSSTHVPTGEAGSGPSLGGGRRTGFDCQPHPSPPAVGINRRETGKRWGGDLGGLGAGHPSSPRAAWGRILPGQQVGSTGLQITPAAAPAPAAPSPSCHLPRASGVRSAPGIAREHGPGPDPARLSSGGAVPGGALPRSTLLTLHTRTRQPRAHACAHTAGLCAEACVPPRAQTPTRLHTPHVRGSLGTDTRTRVMPRVQTPAHAWQPVHTLPAHA